MRRSWLHMILCGHLVSLIQPADTWCALPLGPWHINNSMNLSGKNMVCVSFAGKEKEAKCSRKTCQEAKERGELQVG